MRILGFSEMWAKLQDPDFTTFRFARRDRDYEVGEVVQPVYQPRRKGGGDKLGIAEIIGKEPRFIFEQGRPPLSVVTEVEAMKDGFVNLKWMQLWMWDTYKRRAVFEPMNKLTLRYVSG